MYIISPLSRCASPEKRDVFLSHISQIAPVTYSGEPGCHGYAWFVSAEDNDAVPAHWLRGFEVYLTAEDNSVAHRASEEYKAFRIAVSEQSLLEKPSDLRFWHPTDIGFITREKEAIFGSKEKTSSSQYIVVDDIVPNIGNKSNILSRLETLAAKAMEEETSLTFWVLDRGDAQKNPRSADDDGIYVIARFQDKDACKSFQSRFGDAGWNDIDALCGKRTTTTWVEAGIGFLGRQDAKTPSS